MLTLISFIVALVLLIAVHEYGHYRMAVNCGVKVLRFSIGMGWPLLRWKCKGSDTEFMVAAFPLGGYVRMLDERDTQVPAHERHLAFNTQPLRTRAAIVAAGPVANLLLAVLLYTFINWAGIQAPQAILATPAPGSLAAQAGLQGQEWVHSTASGPNTSQRTIRSFDDLRWQLTLAAIWKHDIWLHVSALDGTQYRTVLLPLAATSARGGMDSTLTEYIGIQNPWTPPRIGDVLAGQPAQQAGLLAGDVVRHIDGVPMVDGSGLWRHIRASLQGAAQVWQIQRGEQQLELLVTPERVHINGTPEYDYGRIGAVVGGPPAVITIQFGILEGFWAGLHKTWEITTLSLNMMGKILTGQASLSNLSGPLSIADHAGQSASLGWSHYVLFLALLSVSLGVLNLLPLPVLDGGHLMYYLWEGITGRPISNVWMERLQQFGVALLLMMMSIAFYNDISRLWG